MKEIYLLSQGDSINKIKHEYHAEKLLSKSKDKLFGFDYVELNNGIDDTLKNQQNEKVYKNIVCEQEKYIDTDKRGSH